MNVLGVRESKWNKQDTGEEVTTYYVSLRDDTGEREVPCYDAKAAELKAGEPLPEGWEVKTSKAGKPYLATPRPARSGAGGGMTAYRNTAEGQAYEQERMDRRTALMQAVELQRTLGIQPSRDGWVVAADQMYEWLRSPLSRAQAAGAPAVTLPSGRGTSSADTGSVEKSEGAASTRKGPAPSDTIPKGHRPGCTFPSVSEFRKDGTTPLPEGKLRCTGCDAILRESEVA